MKKKINWKLALILLISLGLRLIYLNQSLWLDEGIEWWAVTTFNLKQLLFGFMSGDFNPPAHYLWMWFWVRIFGTSEIAMRLPSVLFGVGTVWFTYKIANLIRFDLAGRGQTFTTATLAAVNGLLIYYSQEARAYAMAAFLVTGAMYFLLKGNRGSASWRRGYWGYAILMGLALYTHYLTWLLVPFLVVFGVKYLLPLVFTVPWWPMVWKQLQVGQMVSQNAVWAKIGETNGQNIGLVIVKFITGRVPFSENLFFGGMIILASITIWLLILMRAVKIKNKTDLLIVLWGFGPLILGGLIGMKMPIFIYFRFIFVLPALILLAAKGLDDVKGRWGRLGKLGMIGAFGIFSFLYLFNRSYHREDWKGAVAELHRLDVNPVVIINLAIRPPFDYYDKGESKIISATNIATNYWGIDRVWYVPYSQPIFDPNDEVRKNLTSNGYGRIYEKHFNGVTLEKWERYE